jgi:DNA-binding FadR family transcriptional regulator
MLNNPMQMMMMLKGSNNPMMLMQQMLGNNPQYQQIMSMVQDKNPQQLEQYVRNLYQSQGRDINQIANQFGLKL